MKKAIVLSILFVTFYSCSRLAVSFTQKKEFVIDKSELSKKANKYFWDNYHQANYDSIPQIIDYLNLALAENPKDLITTTHLGFVHIWALSERQRLDQAKPNITEHIYLSHKYFEEAYEMNDKDLRVLGFLADLTLGEGDTMENEKQLTKGYFLGLESIRKWPQFNKFSIGFFFSRLDPSNKFFQKGLEWQYETIDDCSCEKNTRDTDYIAAIDKVRKSTDPQIKRACWNSWIAPHNWEGFCLNWGDMLVKNNEVTEAIRIYNLAKESDNYSEWPYQDELEKRIQNAANNVADFNAPIDERYIKNQNTIMINSKMACMACHEMSPSEYETYGHKEIPESYYFGKTY